MEMLKILHEIPGLTCGALAKWIGVKPFTIHRYLHSLSRPKNLKIRENIRDAYSNLQQDVGIFIPVRVFPISKNDKKLHTKNDK